MTHLEKKSGRYYKSFTIVMSAIVIYDHNDSGLYYKATIVTNLALARSVNYDRRIVIYDGEECHKLKRNLRLYKIFIEQATDACVDKPLLLRQGCSGQIS